MVHSFPFSQQHDAMDCGATCLKMIAKYYGKNYSLETLREKTYISRDEQLRIIPKKLPINKKFYLP